jgi:simple sugar transport system permease protein
VNALLRDRRLPVVVTATLLVVTFLAGASRYQNYGFLSTQVVMNLFIDGSYLLVAAVGATFVILTGGIDLSIGSMIGFSNMLLAWLIAVEHVPAALAILIVVAVGALSGWAMGSVAHHFEIQPFIVTLAGLFLFRGLCLVVSKESISIDDKTLSSLSQMQIPVLDGHLSIGALIGIAAVLVAAYVLARTSFGRQVYAVGGNEQSSVLMGLPVQRTKVGVYTISGFCSALAGVIYTLYIQSGDPLHGIGMELDAIAAVVIGGTLLTGGSGYVLGTMFGVLLLRLVATIVNTEGTLSPWWIRIFIGALLLVFILLQRGISARGVVKTE